MSDEEETTTPLNPDEPPVPTPDGGEGAPSSPDGPVPETASGESGDSADASTETVQVPTALNPDTWPEKTGTVTDPEILAREGLAPDEPPVEVSGKKEVESEASAELSQGEPPSGAEWFQCLVGNLPTNHKFWSKDHLADPPKQVACFFCGSPTVIRSEFYKPPAFMSTGQA